MTPQHMSQHNRRPDDMSCVMTLQLMSRHNGRPNGISCVATLKLMLLHKCEEFLEKQLNNVAILTNLS